MINFTCEQVTSHIKRIRSVGDVCIYLIEGDSSAILVDTAYGVGDLRGYVESITSLPYEVVITHGHADHAVGIDQWPEVYMDSRDIELYRSRSSIELRRQMLRKSVPNIDEIPDSLFAGDFRGTFKDLSEGMVFDLGNLHVEVIDAPGHTQGMKVLLVQEERIALFGDACGVATFLFRPETSTVDEYRKTLYKLRNLSPKFDRILRQHGTCESQLSIVDENLECCELILEGKDDHIPFEYLGYQAYIAKEIDDKTHGRKDGKSGNVFYSMDKIR